MRFKISLVGKENTYDIDELSILNEDSTIKALSDITGYREDASIIIDTISKVKEETTMIIHPIYWGIKGPKFLVEKVDL